jgi:hypothetical protein
MDSCRLPTQLLRHTPDATLPLPTQRHDPSCRLRCLYLSERGQIARWRFSSWMTRKPLEAISAPNGTIHVEAKCATLCLPPPAEAGGFFHNCQVAQTLAEMGWHNHPLSSNAITQQEHRQRHRKPKRTKAMDMSFGGYVTVSARPIQIQWAPGSTRPLFH